MCFEPLRALSYEVRESDIPMHDYRADVTLTPTESVGPDRWRSTFKRPLAARAR